MSNLSTTECREIMDRDLAFRTSTGDMGVELFIDILNEIEDIFFDLDIKANPKKYLTAEAISTGTNPTTIATAYNMDVKGAGVFDANSDGSITDNPFHKSNRGSNAAGYWVEENTDEGGADINFTPSSIGTAVKWAVFIPYRTILEDGDDTLFPSRKAHFVKRALLRYFSLWNRNKGGILAASDVEFLNSLKQIIYNSAVQKEDASLDLDSY